MSTIAGNTKIYSPASIVGIFNNALRLPETVTLILIKGRYIAGQGKSYAGYYYEFLYSEGGPASIGLKIGNVLRTKLQDNEVYVLKGYVEKRIRNSSIDLVFVVEEIIQQVEKEISEEDLKRFELTQQKVELGFKELETLIRDKKLKNETIRIANIYGHNAIVQHDFQEGLGIAVTEFEIENFSCNITSATSILAKLKEIELQNFDIIALVRGGGDRQSFDAFNEVTLAAFFIQIQSVTITAIGHTVDETLLDTLADRRFNLPLDYGVGLRRMIEKLTEEKSNSRALLIEEVKKDVGKQFTEQVLTLTTQLKKKNEEFEKLQQDTSKQMTQLQENTQKQLLTQTQEWEKHKADLLALNEKNLKSTIASETAAIHAKMEILKQENLRLQDDLQHTKPQFGLYVILLAIGVLVGYFLTR